jgi:hypothetical protein
VHTDLKKDSFKIYINVLILTHCFTLLLILEWGKFIFGWFMVFNATFNNISVISGRSVLLVKKPEYPENTIDLPQVIDKIT